MSKTMIEAAHLYKPRQNLLWSDVVYCINVLYNMTTNGDDKITPIKRFTIS